MSNCETCGSKILFGGVQYRGHRYCKGACVEVAREHAFSELAGRVPPQEAIELAQKVFDSPCPRCGGKGPVEIWAYHGYHFHAAPPQNEYLVCCRRCNVRRNLACFFQHLLLDFANGWAGILLMPSNMSQSLYYMRQPNPTQPSPLLVRHCMMEIAAKNPDGDLPLVFRESSIFVDPYNRPVGT